MSDLPDELLEKLEGAKRYERYILSLCPFHDDTKPSFLVYPDKYRCLACGKYGDTQKLLDKLDTLHVYHKPLVSHYDTNNPFTKWSSFGEIWKVINIAFENSPSFYLKSRFISADVQRQLKIGQMDGWITFPIHNPQGKVIGAVARAGEGSNSKSKYMIPHKQNPDMLYVPSWERCNVQDTIYVTFGILDAVTLYAAGFASMSTTTGKRVTAIAFENIRKRICIIPDLGEAPEALKLASKLGWRGKVIQLAYPEKCKDINDMVWKAGIKIEEIGGLINAMD